MAVMGDPPYSVLLERYGREIQKHPQDYSQRSERTALMLEHGNDGDTTAEDIDTLLAHPEWRIEGECLQAARLYLQGRLDTAGALARENIRARAHVRDQARLLAHIESARQDTDSAIAAYHLAWDQGHDENDYVDLLSLHRGRGKPPEEILQQGRVLYPHSPGAVQTIFEVYFAAGDPTNLRKALGISEDAEKILWPQSVDWKLRHARVLLSLNRPHEAETVLLAAMDLVDDNPRLRDDAGRPLRKEIFTLLESARK